jgi:hypothetical protein
VHPNGVDPTHIAAHVRLARSKSDHLAVRNHLQTHLPRQGQHTNQLQQRPGVFAKHQVLQLAQFVQVAPVGSHNLKRKRLAHGCESYPKLIILEENFNKSLFLILPVVQSDNKKAGDAMNCTSCFYITA